MWAKTCGSRSQIKIELNLKMERKQLIGVSCSLQVKTLYWSVRVMVTVWFTFSLQIPVKVGFIESQSSQPDELIYSSTSLSSSASCYHCLLMLLASLYLGMHRRHRCFSTLNPYRISTDTRYWYQYWYVPNGIRSGRQPELQTQHSCHVHATEPKVAESFALLFSPQRLILTKK